MDKIYTKDEAVDKGFKGLDRFAKYGWYRWAMIKDDTYNLIVEKMNINVKNYCHDVVETITNKTFEMVF